MLDFARTPIGRKFLQSDIPRLVKALADISAKMPVPETAVPKIVVNIETNGVAKVISDMPVEVLTLDYDCEGGEHIKLDANGEDCFAVMEDVLHDPDYTHRQFAKYQTYVSEDMEKVVSSFAKLICDRGYDENDLDSEVDELVSRLASKVNNGGLREQVAFLVSQIGVEGMGKWIDEAYPEMEEGN